MKDFSWLGGSIVIERGCRADYEALARFHYLGGKPAVWAGVWVARFRTEDSGLRTECSCSRVVAVGVLSHPTGRCKNRERRLGLRVEGRCGPMQWLNENLRTISRVIVHPQFRAIGLAAELVRVMCAESGVRYVESIAVMGEVVPFFERAGMEKVASEGKAYFLWDREEAEEVTR